jgi:CheY-specific phosphatase CheX
MALLVESAVIPDEITDSVRQSVIDIFTSMCGFQPEFLKICEQKREFSGFIGSIAFFGDMDLLLFLGLTYDTSSSMARRFTGFDIALESDAMDDVVGEMANIIAGDVVARLEKIGIYVRMSTPSVARGNDLKITILEGLAPKQLFFNSPDGKFWVKFSVIA